MERVMDMSSRLPGFAMTEEDRYEMAIAQPLEDKVQQAIGLLQLHEPAEGYYLAYSGGKDSGCILELARMAGVKFRPHYNVTTLDPPELVRFIRREHPEVAWNRPKRALLTEMVENDGCKGPPTRLARWCCEEYKEQGGNGQFKILGIRAPESPRRKLTWKRLLLNRNGCHILCPILYWTDDDVWQFHRDRSLPYCELYDQGFKRLGCVGCPLGGPNNQRKEFDRWPGFEKAWRRAFYKFWDKWHGVPVQTPKWVAYDPQQGPPKRATQTRERIATNDEFINEGNQMTLNAIPGFVVYEYLHDWRYFEDFGDPDTFFEWWISGGKKEEPQEECQGLNLYN